MKKIFAFVMAITMVVCVMVMGPEKALATTETVSNVYVEEKVDDISRATRVFEKLVWYVENNPHWNEKVAKLMIARDGDTIVVSTAFLRTDELEYETYRYSSDELAELDVIASTFMARAMVGVWES